MSRGQIAGQIFIYIMAAIVIGGIAYSAIQSIFAKTCDAGKVTFKADMDSMIEKYTAYGSVNKKLFAAPCDYETICFVDKNAIGNNHPSTPFSCDNQIIQDSVTSTDKIEQNIFVISGKKTTGLGYSDLITLAVPEKCTCITQRNNNFYITFKGKGSSVEISETT